MVDTSLYGGEDRTYRSRHEGANVQAASCWTRRLVCGVRGTSVLARHPMRHPPGARAVSPDTWTPQVKELTSRATPPMRAWARVPSKRAAVDSLLLQRLEKAFELGLGAAAVRLAATRTRGIGLRLPWSASCPRRQSDGVHRLSRPT